MDNDKVLEALEEFGRDPNPTNIPPLLGRYLERIATTGETLFPWPSVKPLFAHKLDEAMKKFHAEVPTDHLAPCPNVENISFDAMRQRLLNIVDSFTGTPFTIQRLCELVTQPTKHYKRTDKFLRGIEKNMLVVSSIDAHGNKIVYESKPMVNGMSSNGLESVHGTPGKSFLTPPAPANSPVTTATGCITNTETWAQGGGDAPVTSAMPPSPLARQPVRMENRILSIAATLSGGAPSKNSAKTGETSSEKEQSQEHQDSEKETTKENSEVVEGKGDDKIVTERMPSAILMESDSQSEKKPQCETKASNSGKSRMDEYDEQKQDGTAIEADTEGPKSAKNLLEQTENSEPASATGEITESETDDVLRRDSGDSGGFEASDDISDLEVAESSTGPDPAPVLDQHQVQAAEVQASSPSQPASELSSKRPQPEDSDESGLPCQSPCKKPRRGDKQLADSKEAEGVEQTEGHDSVAGGRQQRKCEIAPANEDSTVADCSSSTPAVSSIVGECESRHSGHQDPTDANTPDSQTESKTSSEICTTMQDASQTATEKSCAPSSSDLCAPSTYIDTSCTQSASDPCTPSTCTDTSHTPSDSETCTARDVVDDGNTVSSTQVVLPNKCDDNDDHGNTPAQTRDGAMEVDS